MNKQGIIVVTGATGFIGSNLLYALESSGYSDIVGIDSFGSGAKWKNVENRSFTQFVLPEQAQTFFEANKHAVMAVIHLGAISSTTETDVDKIVKTNIQLSIYLYKYCKQNNIQFIYASSAATYGITGKEVNDFVDVQDMQGLALLHPANAYGWSKHCVDKYIASDVAKSGHTNQVVGLKFFNVYGPNEYHKGEQISVIAKFYKQYSEHGVARLFRPNGNESPRRDFVYVNDCVKVIIWMLEHKEISGLYNVGTGRAITFETVAKQVASCLGLEPKIEYIEMPPSLQKQYQAFTVAHLEKLRAAGYTTEMTPIEIGVNGYVKQYLYNNVYK